MDSKLIKQGLNFPHVRPTILNASWLIPFDCILCSPSSSTNLFFGESVTMTLAPHLAATTEGKPVPAPSYSWKIHTKRFQNRTRTSNINHKLRKLYEEEFKMHDRT